MAEKVEDFQHSVLESNGKHHIFLYVFYTNNDQKKSHFLCPIIFIKSLIERFLPVSLYVINDD